MAPRRDNKRNLNNNNYIKNCYRYLKSWMKSEDKYKDLVALATDPKKLFLPALLFIIFDAIINIVIIEKRPYTEIDWKAYMQEVEGVLNGTFDYSKLRGDTGPLVYPAGFVYIFTALYYITSHGVNIKLAQYIFALFHVVLLVLVFKIYQRTKKVPPYILILVFSTSYRIHSIFVLRLFNDPIAMIFLYASIIAFLEQKWYTGSILYSLAVSVKMNILLFAPALLIAYITNLGLLKTIAQLFVCAFLQLLLGLPFLLNNPIAYIKGAFNLARIFEFKWTVNWRFLTEELFVNSYFHFGLLALHVLALIYFAPQWFKYLNSYKKLKTVQKDISSQFDKKTNVDMSTASQLFVLPLFMANFIGLTFSRSLHYQFYIWYYHTLPYITWCCNYRTATKLVIIGLIELCWNTYPSTVFSSACLHFCHLVLLYGLNNHLFKTLKSS
ncbi:lethal(2)neighbour of Tid protein [Copidosoma floridanum]|uniref:lethal(2)neighbour of Tid protein n=1 Tax=Copidosoma floridanum TaxID=29053 RepID=UPI0006C97BE2|nr:lethal(2)neighbour of Tid protein [Copidosoma floridanum]